MRNGLPDTVRFVTNSQLFEKFVVLWIVQPLPTSAVIPKLARPFESCSVICGGAWGYARGVEADRKSVKHTGRHLKRFINCLLLTLVTKKADDKRLARPLTRIRPRHSIQRHDAIKPLVVGIGSDVVRHTHTAPVSGGGTVGQIDPRQGGI